MLKKQRVERTFEEANSSREWGKEISLIYFCLFRSRKKKITPQLLLMPKWMFKYVINDVENRKLENMRKESEK